MEQKLYIKKHFSLSDGDIEKLEIALSQKSLENRFFEVRTELKWFKPLFYLKYFEPENEELPKEVEKGKYYVPVWNILIYLENISKNEDFQEKKELVKLVLDIIANVTHQHKIKREISNYNTWWYFVKILCNIPNNLIQTSVLENIDIWLDTKFDATLITSEITQKLLPKFVNENSTKDDINKAETIFDILFKIYRYENPEEFSKYFGRVNYEFRAEYYWFNELFESENFVKTFAEICTQKFFNDIETKICTLLKVEENISKFRMGNDTLSIGVKATDNRSTYDIKVYLLKNTSLLETIYDNITNTKRDNQLLTSFKISLNNLDEFSSELKKKFEVIDEIIYTEKELEIVIRNIFFSFYSDQTLDSLYDDSRKPYSDPIELLCEVSQKIILAKSNSNNVKNLYIIENILKHYFCHNFLFFKKLALYILAESQNDYKYIFFENLNKPEVNIVIFEASYFGDELNHFLSGLKKLNKVQKAELEKYIERGSIYDWEDVIPNFNILWKQKLYKALAHVDRFKIKYDKLKAKTHKDPTLGPAIGMVDSGYFNEDPGKSPLSIDDLLIKPNEYIADLLVKLKNEKANKDGYTFGGLCNNLSEAIKSKPQKFVEVLKPFVNSSVTAINTIFEAIKEAVKNKKKIVWKELFAFIEKYLDTVDWQVELKREYSPRDITHKWNLHSIATLIQEGARDNKEWMITDKDLKTSLKLLLRMANYYKFLQNDYQKFENEDYLTITINTTLGKIIEALIYVSRRIGTTKTMKNKESRLPVSVFKFYEMLLKEKVMEVHSLIGCYIYIFTYLDKSWLAIAIKNIEKLFVDETLLWNAFMDGYFWSGKVYIDLYKLQRKNYEYSLDFKFRNQHSRDRLIEHLSIGYIADVDNLDEKSLFRKLLNKNDPETLIKVINTFWSFKDTIVFKTYNLSTR